MEWKKYTTETSQEVLSALRTTQKGLESTEAKRRLLEYGKNSVQGSDRFLWRVLKKRGTSYLSWVFILAAISTSLFGNFIEAGFIILFLLLNISLEIYQELHSEKAAQSLERFLLPKTRVRRDGEIIELPSHFLVPGDIVELSAGESFPADVRLLEGENCIVNEALISSERRRVEKTIESATATPFAPSEAVNIGFAGTTLIKGRVQGVVIATAAATALGDIAYDSSLNTKETPFEKNIKNFSHFLVKLLLMGLAGVLVLYLLMHGEQAEMSEILIFTLVLAITVIPEAFPAITALALARGSVRLAKKNLVVKRLSAIEDLGSVEILCMDKTGILTKNSLTVTHFSSQNLTESLRYALLASHRIPSAEERSNDAFDRALWNKADGDLRQKVIHTSRIQALDFDPHTRLQVVSVEEGDHNTVIIRGAPEEILRRVEKLDSFTRKGLQDWIREAGARGERVLAVATKTVSHQRTELHIEGNFTFQGLIAFLDPIKSDTKKTVELAERLGVAIKIFSGDSKETVGAVGYATGIAENSQAVITGTEFEVLSLPEQLEALENYSVFARFSPTQKAIAVQLLQKTYTVGVVGGGLADTEMLRFANVAMLAPHAGGISREAADIILLERELHTVIEGIQESRRVFANILKYLKVTLASNFGNFYSITLAALFLPYLPLLPLQILLLNFLSDIPMLAIANDSVDQEKLERPKDHSIHAIIVTATLFGVISSFFDLTLFKIFSEYNASTVQTVWFLFSIITEVLLLYSLRSRRWFFKAKRPSLTLLLLSILAGALAIYIPYTAMGTFLGFTELTQATWLTILAFVASYFAVTEILKRWYYVHSALFKQPRTF